MYQDDYLQSTVKLRKYMIQIYKATVKEDERINPVHTRGL